MQKTKRAFCAAFFFAIGEVLLGSGFWMICGPAGGLIAFGIISIIYGIAFLIPTEKRDNI